MRRASIWLMIVALLFPSCLPVSALSSHGPGSVADEQEKWWGDAFQSFAVEGCLPAPSGTTTVVLDLCRAYIRESAPTPRLRYAAELTPQALVLNNGDGIYWVAIHRQRTPSVGGWTTVGTTHYLWQWAAADVTIGDAALPTVPDGMLLIAQIMVSGGAASFIGDHRPESPMPGGPVNAMAPLFGVEQDCVTNDHAALQRAINNSAWRGIYRTYLPAAPPRSCYLITSSLWLSYDAAGNPDHPGKFAIVFDGNVELFGDKPLYFGAQAPIRTTGTQLRSTGDQPLLRSDSVHAVNGARLMSVRSLSFRSNATTQPAIYLKGAAGVTMEELSVWQSGEGGSGILLEDYDRANLKEIIIEGPRIPTPENPPTAGGRALWLRGTGADNSGSLVESVHVRGFDRCLQLGHDTPITEENNNSILFTFNSVGFLNCNEGAWIGDGTSHLVFNSPQVNGNFVTGFSIGDRASHIQIVGGTINSTQTGIRIGRGSTQATHISVRNTRISSIPETTGVGIRIDSSHSLSQGHRFEDIRFHCRGDDTGIPVELIGPPRGGIFENNSTETCLGFWGGTHPGTYTAFDRLVIPEVSTHFGTPTTNVNNLRLRRPNPGGVGILELWEVAESLDFPVVVAQTCSAVLQIPHEDIMNAHFPIWRKPELATLGLEAEMWLTDGFVNVKLCNNTAADSANPVPQVYGAAVFRIQTPSGAPDEGTGHIPGGAVPSVPAEPCIADTVIVLLSDYRVYVCDETTLTWETATGGGLTQAANLPATCTVGQDPILLPDANLCGCTATDVWTCNDPATGTGGDTPGANTVGPSQLQAVAGTPGTYGSATQIFSGTVDDDGRVSNASNIPLNGLTPVLTAAPEEPCVENHVFILAGTTNQYICDAEGSYQVMGGTGGGTTVHGIQTSINGVLSQHWVVTPLSGTQDLGSGNEIVAVTVGTLGATLRLPDPTLIDTPTHITIFIVDEGTGYLTVLPFATENIGLLGNLSPVPISGKGSKYEFTLIDTENWHLSVSAPILPGELGGETLCGGVAGSVDNAATDVGVDFNHSLTCLVPVAAQLKAGTVLQACSMFDLVTGAVAPQLRVGLKAGTTVLATMGPGQPGTSLSPRSMVFCLLIILAADPTATTNTYTAPVGMMNALDNVADANIVQQPVVVDWSVDKTLTWYSNLDIPGTAPNTLTQMANWTTIFKR